MVCTALYKKTTHYHLFHTLHTHTLLNLLYTQDSQPMKMQRYLTVVCWQRLMAESEPLIQEADPPIIKAQK